MSIKDPNLKDLFIGSEDEDFHILIDHITDQGKGRLSVSSDICDMLVNSKKSGVVNLEARAAIEKELRQFGGNSIINIFRGGEGVSYKEILCDVAGHLKVSYNKTNTCSEIEIAILMKILEKSIESMSDKERNELLQEFGGRYTAGLGASVIAAIQIAIKTSGFLTYKLAAIVANYVAKALIGRGLTFGATGAMMRGISVFAGPIGWTITGLWAAFDLASPAYRITIPCVIQIAFMRQKMIYEKLPSCSKCHAPVTFDSNFCSECGHDLRSISIN